MDHIASLIGPHIPALRRYSWALVREHDAADDLVQDCLERAISRWHLRRTDGDLRAWLFTIQRNIFISRLRQHARRGPHLRPEALDDLPAADLEPDSALRARDLLAGLDLLPEEHRSVLLLVGVEDLSYEQAARVLGIPIGTVMSRLSRAREKMRRYLETGAAPALRRVK